MTFHEIAVDTTLHHTSSISTLIHIPSNLRARRQSRVTTYINNTSESRTGEASGGGSGDTSAGAALSADRAARRPPHSTGFLGQAAGRARPPRPRPSMRKPRRSNIRALTDFRPSPHAQRSLISVSD
ncbi:hypothetical protein EVAR_11991_1 [Eumeta japonica]|uniref:Uncharacterized protein n=1 Tax=Eumeta variegata TaxID=151549 RepID=A0A4C1U561_EUMVA|nr:hypothetical protein EVAR_11991_1 [Eumeta japonica]